MRKKAVVFSMILVGVLLCLALIARNVNKDDEYLRSMHLFYDLYFEVASNINNSDKLDTILSELRKNQNQILIEDMGNILLEMKTILGNKKNITEKTESNFDKLTEWYSEMKLLGNAKYQGVMDMSDDERLQITSKLMNIRYRLNNWEDEDSNYAWEW